MVTLSYHSRVTGGNSVPIFLCARWLEMDLGRARSRFCKIFETCLSSENYAIDQRRGDRLEPGGCSTPRGVEIYLFTSCDRYLHTCLQWTGSSTRQAPTDVPRVEAVTKRDRCVCACEGVHGKRFRKMELGHI
jgi:hypothetical protein